MLLNVAAVAGCRVGGEMGRGLKATHATGRAEGVSDLEEGGVGYCSVTVFVDRDLGTGVNEKKDAGSQVSSETRVLCRNACLYIFSKMITQPLKRMQFHQLQKMNSPKRSLKSH